MTVSVCTIARGRARHLVNLVHGLNRQTQPPLELVIAYMQTAPFEDLPATGFPIRQVHVDGQAARLAAARNRAARAASGQQLVFLDVDCIPLPDLVDAYTRAWAHGRCLMGETRYLARAHTASPMPADMLWHVSRQHPARCFSERLGPGLQALPDATEFWSLSFSLSAKDFWSLGGFDDDFEGYGGEDTDFAMRLGLAHMNLYWTPDARAVHQWHRVEKPPLSHLSDIVTNANLFYCKHGRWCMRYWLDQFASDGYIKWREDRIEILRFPSAHEREAARCDGTVRFS